MRPQIAFLHTSPVHVETFDRLVRAADATVTVEHVVAEDLLADAQRLGADDPALIQRVEAAMTGAAATGAAVVVCTCSTLGSAAEAMATQGSFIAARIDRAMADRAVELGPRVLVVAALESTLAPTAALIRESAASMQADVNTEFLLVRQAWPHFLRGDRARYVETIASAVRSQVWCGDVMVLAQASMAPAAEALQDLGIPVLSSPALGVQAALRRLREAA